MNYKATSYQKVFVIASNFSHAIWNLVTQRTLPLRARVQSFSSETKSVKRIRQMNYV